MRVLPVFPSRRALVLGSGWLASDRVLRIGLGLVLNVVLARVYGPADFGLYAYALTLAALFLPLATLGLERIVVREIARGSLAEGCVLASALLLRLAGAAAGWSLAFAWVLLTGSDGSAALVLVAIIVAGNIVASFDVVDWSFQARGDFRTTTAAKLAAFVLGTALKISLALGGAGLRAVAAAVLVELSVSAVLQLAVWRASGRSFGTLRWDGTLARRLLLSGLPLVGADIAVWIFQRVDIVVLNHEASVQAVGVYSVAQRLAQAAFFLPGLAVQLFSPDVARAADDAEAMRVVRHAMDALAMLAIALAGFLSIAAPFLVEFLFGPQYADAARLLRVLAWSNPFVFLGAAHALYLVNRGHQGLLLRLSWMTAAASLILNLLLIPRWQAFGAAAANVAAFGTTTLLGVACFRGSRPLFSANLLALLAPFRIVAHALRPKPRE